MKYKYRLLPLIMFVATLIGCETEVLKEENFIPSVDIGEEDVLAGDRLQNPYWEWVKKFPGAVADSAERKQNAKFSITPNYKMWGELQITNPSNPQWYSTGFYAAPADIVTINVPEGIEGSVKCRMGVWNCKLDSFAVRPPVIWKYVNLVVGENKIYNYFGGHLYLIFSEPSEKTYEFTFSNVVESPDYILGESNFEEWQERLKKSAAPWGEIGGEKMILTLPIEQLRTLKNPDELLAYYDEFLKLDYDKLWGLTPDNEDPKHRSPSFPWRMTTDIELCAGAAHAGYPFIASSSWAARGVDLEWMQQKDWGFYHELGHNYQTYGWKPGYFVEVTCNLHVYHLHNRKYNDWPSKDKFADFYWGLNNWVNAEIENKDFSALYSSSGPYGQKLTTMILPFIQLAQKYGWKYLTYLNRSSREYATNSRDNQVRMDFFLQRVTEYAGVNLMPFFNAWGMKPSKYAKIYIEQFPDYTEEPFWTVFDESVIPDLEIERTPVIMPEVEQPKVLDVAQWTLLGSSGRSSDSSPDARGAEGLFDKNRSTFWISNQLKRPVLNPRPWVEVDLNKPHMIWETTFHHRIFSYNHVKVESFKVYYKLEKEADWQEIDTFTLTPDHGGEQKFEFTKPVKARYLRLEPVRAFSKKGDDYDYSENGAVCISSWGANGYEIKE